MKFTNFHKRLTRSADTDNGRVKFPSFPLGQMFPNARIEKMQSLGFCGMGEWRFKHLRIGQKLYFSFCFIIILMVAVLSYTYRSFAAESEAVVANVKSYEVLNEANAILICLINMETGVRGFILTGKEEFLTPYKSGKEEYQKHITKIEELTTNTEQIKRIRNLRGNLQNWEARELTPLLFMQSNVANGQNGMDSIIRHIQTGFGKQDMDEMRKILAEFDQEERAALEKRSQELYNRKSSTREIMIFGGLAATIAGMLLAFFITGAITRPVHILDSELTKLAENGGDLTQTIQIDSKDEIGDLALTINRFLADLQKIMTQVLSSAENVAASAEQLTANAQQSSHAANQVVHIITDVANGAQNQANEINGVSVVIEQMSASIKQVAVNCNQVAGISDKTAVAAQNGGESINKAIRQMASIDETVTNSSQVVAKLGERSKEIGQIVETISGIAGQTNLLALNAAIEAARAGEQGRGFAVVADEVRKLAEQSQEAAKKISQLITEIKNDTDNAVIAMNSGTQEAKTGIKVVNIAGVAFKEIVTLVDDVSKKIREVSSMIQEMASGSLQIVVSVHDIRQVSKEAAAHTETVSAASEQQSASMEEISAASQALAKLSEQLTNAVNKFSV
jgi:methyl-accepting chemotaxis protein